MTTIFRVARKELPVTTVCILLSSALFAAVAVEHAIDDQSLGETLAHWGAESKIGLWNGQWWRIFVTAFHHGGFLHLMMNALALWFQGKLLEPRLGALRFALFVVGSIAVSGVAESYFGSWVGLSGLAFAEFGAILVLRTIDDGVAAEFNDQVVYSGLIFLFACIPLTYLDILPVANVAHFVGLIYGWMAGAAFFLKTPFRNVRLASFLAGHLLLLPAFYFVMHPFWDGLYHWRLAELALKANDLAETLSQSEQAIARDPQLTGPWLIIAGVHVDHGRRLEAWKYLLRAIQVNPCFEGAIHSAKRVWRRLPSPDAQQEALQTLREIFGAEAPQWEKTLTAETDVKRTALARGNESLDDREAELSEEWSTPLGTLDEPPPKPRTLPAPKADQPGSAEEGRQT